MRTLEAIAKDAAIQCFHNAFDPLKLERIITEALLEFRSNTSHEDMLKTELEKAIFALRRSFHAEQLKVASDIERTIYSVRT